MIEKVITKLLPDGVKPEFEKKYNVVGLLDEIATYLHSSYTKIDIDPDDESEIIDFFDLL